MRTLAAIMQAAILCVPLAFADERIQYDSRFFSGPNTKHGSHLAKYFEQEEQKKQQKKSEVQTNGEIEPNYPFTFMLITGGGSQSQGTPAEQALRQWLFSPQTPGMARWRSMANVREYAAGDSAITEHHQHLIAKHQTLPVVALVDSRGGDWCSLSGGSLPGSEYELSRVLDVYYAAIMQAASEFQGNVRMMSLEQLEAARAPFRSGPQRGPQPIQPAPPRRGPFGGGGLINIPDDYNINAETGVNPETRKMMLVGMGVMVFLGLLVFAGLIIAAALIGFAQTDPDDEDMVINQEIDE